MHHYNIILYHALFVLMSVITVNTLGCNYFSSLEIRPTNCYNLPGKMNFLEIGGVYHPPPPKPPEVSALELEYLTFSSLISNRHYDGLFFYSLVILNNHSLLFCQRMLPHLTESSKKSQETSVDTTKYQVRY